MNHCSNATKMNISYNENKSYNIDYLNYASNVIKIITEADLKFSKVRCPGWNYLSTDCK